MPLVHRIFRLKGVVQHYSWGGHDFIPQLLGVDNKERQPFAEYWLGAHPNHPAFIEEENIPLNEFISRNTEEVLGDEVAKEFSSLPYLLKVLDVRQMLSIQVHPSKEAAARSFDEEEKKGIPVTAPHRNYKDKNHKPELMVALSDFWLLHGFKEGEKLLKILKERDELKFLANIFIERNYKGLYEEVMLMSQEKVNDVLSPLLQRIVPLYQNDKLVKESEDFWAARAALNFCKDDSYDRGIFSIYFFNLLHLKKGEGVFQPSGLPHAYLEGQNVEVMANSDNVLRAGLTDKHIDVAELMKHVNFEATIPNILGYDSKDKIFTAPVREFELSEYSLTQNKEKKIHTQTAEIFILTEGEVECDRLGEKASFKKGEAFLVAANTDIIIKAVVDSVIFRVSSGRG